MSRKFVGAAALAVAMSFGFAASEAAAGVYVSNELSEIKPDQWVKNPHPQAVQLMFEFQTNGAANARATKALKDKVVETVKTSALFSDVLDQPAPTGALLHVVINELFDAKAREQAESKGFTTGFTFGLVGNTVAETYECTVEYVAGASTDKIAKTAHQKLYFQVGLTAPTPENATKAASLSEAVYAIARQCTANPLNAVAGDPAFAGAPAVAAPAAVTAPAAAAAPAPDAAPAAPAPQSPSASAPAAPPTPAAPDTPKATDPNAPKTPQGVQP